MHYSDGFESSSLCTRFCQSSLIMMSCNSIHRILLWVFILLVSFVILIIYLEISKQKVSVSF